MKHYLTYAAAAHAALMAAYGSIDNYRCDLTLEEYEILTVETYNAVKALSIILICDNATPCKAPDQDIRDIVEDAYYSLCAEFDDADLQFDYPYEVQDMLNAAISDAINSLGALHGLLGRGERHIRELKEALVKLGAADPGCLD